LLGQSWYSSNGGEDNKTVERNFEAYGSGQAEEENMYSGSAVYSSQKQV